MSSAGQANEAGSVFRRDAAVHFAVHALAGAQVGSLPNASPVTRIDFETADPTDDIRVTHQDGTQFFISAKRAAGLDKPTKDTVADWVAQAPTLRPGDLLILAAAETTGTLKTLQNALDRARAGGDIRGDFGVKLKWLDDRVKPAKLRPIVRNRAHIVEFTRTPTNNTDQNLLVTMMNNLVEGHRGAAALDCLATHLHTVAGLGSGSGVETWLEVLESKGFRLRPAAAGSAAVRYAKAVTRYRRALSKDQGIIDLSLLADDLDPLPKRDILDGIRINDSSRERSTSRPIVPVVRRKRRLLVLGQPGTGKSKALWELAAHFTQEEDAPEPIRVRLFRLVRPHRPESLELADLIAEAATVVPVDDRQLVRAHLQRAADAGQAILILDGLDECGDDATWVAQQLTTLVAGLHPDHAVVLTTRPSAEVPARRLGFDEIILEIPHDLTDTLNSLLAHCSTRIPEAGRKEWLAGRKAWLREALEKHEAILGVPQLAILVVLLAAKSNSPDVPYSRAQILHDAVHQSVEQLELTRFRDGAVSRWSPELTPRMLLDAFVTLGRLLDGQAEQPKDHALAKLAEMLGDPAQWNEAPAKADELARQVLRFWDEHIGVFTVDESDSLSARSKVFCEVATAMWVSRQNDENLPTWIGETIPYYDAQGVISLAQGLDPRVGTALLDLGETDPMATLAVGNAALSDVRQPVAAELDRLVEQLVRHSMNVESGDRELPERMNRPGVNALESWQKRRDRGPKSWTLTEVFCALELPAALRPVRDRAIVDLNLAAPYDDIARATAVLVNARADDRALTGEELKQVQAVIDIDLPEREEPVRTGRRRLVIGTSNTPLGLSIVAELATEHLDELAEGSDRKLFQISRRVGFRNSFKVVARLRHAGVDTKRWDGPHPLAAFTAAFADYATHERTLLQDIASLGDTDAELTKAQRWSLPELADLLHASGYHDIDVVEFRDGFGRDTAAIRRPWFRAVSRVYGIDRDMLAAQAQLVLARTPEGETSAGIGEWSVLEEEPAPPVRRPNFDLMTDPEQNALVDGLFAASTWFVDTSMWLLCHKAGIWDRDRLFNTPLEDWSPRRSSVFRQVAIVAEPPSKELLERAAASEHSVDRNAARNAIAMVSYLDADGAIRKRLAADPDMWVRGKLLPDPAAPAPEYWTCPWCPTQNPMDVEDCSGCEYGVRPDAQH